MTLRRIVVFFLLGMVMARAEGENPSLGSAPGTNAGTVQNPPSKTPADLRKLFGH